MVRHPKILTLSQQNIEQGSLERFLLALLGMLIVLAPNIPLFPGYYSPRGEDFILIILAVLWLSIEVAKRQRRAIVLDIPPKGSPIATVLAGMFYIGIFSIGIGTIAFNQTIILNDWMLLPMIVRYWMILQAGRWLTTTIPPRVFIRVLTFTFLLAAIIGPLQYFNLFGINNWFTPHYMEDNSGLILNATLLQEGLYGRRTTGTVSDPRHYAYVLVVGMSLGIALLTYMRQGTQKWLALGLSILCLLSITTTSSRTGLLSCVVVTLFAFMLIMYSGRFRLSLLIAIIVVGMVIVVIASTPAFSTFRDRVLDTNTQSFDRSYAARVRDLVTPFEEGIQTPLILLIGRGPSKAAVRTDSHDDFGWYFYRFGLPGLILYLSLFSASLKTCLHALKSADDPMKRALAMTSCLLVANWFVFAWAENIFKHPQLMALNMLFIGIALGYNDLAPKD